MAPVSLLTSVFLAPHRLQTILNQVSVQKKRAFVELVLNYWTLKRQSRNGLPLIRRLQTSMLSQKNAQPVCSSVSPPQKAFSLHFAFYKPTSSFLDSKLLSTRYSICV